MLAEPTSLERKLSLAGGYIASIDPINTNQTDKTLSSRARSHPNFHWLIPDHLDTTATSTLAAYDRIIVVGEQLRSSVVPGSAGVLRFDEQMGLGEEQLLKVQISPFSAQT